MTEYDYFYDDTGATAPNILNLHSSAKTPYQDPWQYDADTRRVMARNVERSLLLDARRAALAPTTEQHRARVLAELEQGHR